MINRFSHSPELITQDLVSLISDHLTGVKQHNKVTNKADKQMTWNWVMAKGQTFCDLPTLLHTFLDFLAHIAMQIFLFIDVRLYFCRIIRIYKQ